MDRRRVITRSVGINMKKLIIAALFILFGTQSFANTTEILMKVDEMNAHIKCFANLSKASLGATKTELKALRTKQEAHEDIALTLGRAVMKKSPEDFRHGIDYYLGGYFQRVTDGQYDKILCNDPMHIGACPIKKWLYLSNETVALYAMNFYKRENCGILLK
tara:strand:- start:558 stop:1043 length:486 start_codon:yes stop_codon:yes gene_type:complete